MYKYIRCYNEGYKDGSNCARSDIFKNKKRRFKRINTYKIKSKLYDIGYIDGYNTTIKKLTLNLYKNIV